ncbi:MAG: hypothetical protein CK551_10595 [Planctomycetaceae bacterium]|nr:MAG: hypothetical protein CK551_10595 [Planctomycetaceae bacterium]
MKIIFDHLHGHVENDRVFCEAFVIPEGESDEELLALGFLPNLQPPLYWYQARSCRINSNRVILSYKRKNCLSQLDIEIFNYSDIANEADLFFSNYFIIKNFDLQSSYNNNSNFEDLKIMKVKLNETVVAYTRFREFKEALLGLETAMLQNLTKFSLGKDAILLLSNYGKSKNKNYLYIYESYKNYFPYKTEITGSEYWEGEKWIASSV